MNETTFNTLVKSKREEQGIPVSELQKRMGYKNRSSITRLEREQNPTLNTIRETAKGLGCPVPALIPECAELVPEKRPSSKSAARIPISKPFIATLAVIFASILALAFFMVNDKNSERLKQADRLFGMGAFYYPKKEAKKQPLKARACFGRLSTAEQMQANINLFPYLASARRAREGGFNQSYKYISTWYCGDWKEKYPSEK